MRKRMFGALATAAAFAGIVGVTATPAAAAGWITPDQVHSIKNPVTAVAKETPAGSIQVRHGSYGGVQHGWGRVVNPKAGYNLIFEVDLNGDRKMDTWAAVRNLSAGGIKWTHGYPTSSSSTRAFRACITRHSSCAETNAEHRTAWW